MVQKNYNIYLHRTELRLHSSLNNIESHKKKLITSLPTTITMISLILLTSCGWSLVPAVGVHYVSKA